MPELILTVTSAQYARITNAIDRIYADNAEVKTMSPIQKAKRFVFDVIRQAVIGAELDKAQKDAMTVSEDF